MYCKHCGKEIRDGISYCPACGKPVGTAGKQEKETGTGITEPPKKKKPDKKLLAGAVGIAALILVGIVAGRTLLSGGGQDVTADGSGQGGSGGSFDEAQSDPGDEKWANNKSYKKAYKEEYDSFETMVQEYSEAAGREYTETLDEYADQIDEIYKAVEKEIPDLSDRIAADIASTADGETASAIIEAAAGAAIDNETVRKSAYKATMIAMDSLLSYAANYTSTDYPFGFETFAVSGDYALLRSNGTYDDFYKVTKQSMSYDTKMEAIQARIADLEAEASNTEDEDEYAGLMGRIAAEEDRQKETEDLFLKCMASVACGGQQYCVDSASPKLFLLVDKDGKVYNTFWATRNIGVGGDDCNLTLNSNGSCFISSPTERFVIDRNGDTLFEGNSFAQREEEAEGDSIICTYGPSGNALRETKMKDSENGTYYVLELVNEKGKASEVLEIKDVDEQFGYLYPISGFRYDPVHKILWNDDTNGSMYCSDYTLLRYISLDGKEEEAVVDLSSGELTSREEFEEKFLSDMSEETEENAAFCETGSPQDGWFCDVDGGKIYTENEFGLSERDAYNNRSELDTGDVGFNMDALKEKIDESRDLRFWYCRDDLLWVVTKSGYFYTCDLKGGKKSSEVEIGEDASCYFTPYGLLVCAENQEEAADNEQSNGGSRYEYCVYQYDKSGKVIAEYPSYKDSVSTGDVYGFLYYNGRDTYNLELQEVISIE